MKEHSDIISDEMLAAYLCNNTLPIENLCINNAISDSMELKETIEIYKDIVDSCEQLDLNELKTNKIY